MGEICLVNYGLLSNTHLSNPLLRAATESHFEIIGEEMIVFGEAKNGQIAPLTRMPMEWKKSKGRI